MLLLLTMSAALSLAAVRSLERHYDINVHTSYSNIDEETAESVR